MKIEEVGLVKKLLLILGILGLMAACSSSKPVEEPANTTQVIAVEEVETAPMVTTVKPDK